MPQCSFRCGGPPRSTVPHYGAEARYVGAAPRGVPRGRLARRACGSSSLVDEETSLEATFLEKTLLNATLLGAILLKDTLLNATLLDTTLLNATLLDEALFKVPCLYLEDAS